MIVWVLAALARLFVLDGSHVLPLKDVFKYRLSFRIVFPHGCHWTCVLLIVGIHSGLDVLQPNELETRLSLDKIHPHHRPILMYLLDFSHWCWEVQPVRKRTKSASDM